MERKNRKYKIDARARERIRNPKIRAEIIAKMIGSTPTNVDLANKSCPTCGRAGR